MQKGERGGQCVRWSEKVTEPMKRCDTVVCLGLDLALHIIIIFRVFLDPDAKIS